MSKTFDQGKDEVAKLCQYFATNQQSFLAPGVKEDHVRQSLIDPFFEATDWETDRVQLLDSQAYFAQMKVEAEQEGLR